MYETQGNQFETLTMGSLKVLNFKNKSLILYLTYMSDLSFDGDAMKCCKNYMQLGKHTLNTEDPLFRKLDRANTPGTCGKYLYAM